MKIIKFWILTILFLIPAYVVASGQSEQSNSYQQQDLIGSFNRARKRLQAVNNITDIGIVRLKYNQKNFDSLPFAFYKSSSDVEYISPPNICTEKGNINHVVYESYFGNGWDPIMDLLEKRAPLFLLDQNYRWPVTYFGKENFKFWDIRNVWAVTCTNSLSTECEMTKGAFHLKITLDSQAPEGYLKIITLQENDRDKINSEGKGSYLNMLWSDSLMSIQIDNHKIFEINMDYTHIDEFYKNTPKIIAEMMQGKTVTTTYDYAVNNQFKTYKSTMDLFGFKEAYEYML